MDCVICLDTKSDISVKCCKSNYHTTCLEKWLKINNICPICRKHIKNKAKLDKFTTGTGLYHYLLNNVSNDQLVTTMMLLLSTQY